MLLYYRYTVYIDEGRTSPCFHAYVGAEREADARGMLREELKQIPAFLRISEAESPVREVPSTMPYEHLPTPSSNVHLFKVA